MSRRKFFEISYTIAGVCIISALLRSFLFAYAGLKAADTMYNQLIKSLMHTSISFYEKNSMGRLVNRVGKDTFCVDDQLPFIVNIVLAQIFMLFGSFAIMIVSSPYVSIISFLHI